MTKDETLRLALDTLKEVREETFRLMRNGERLYAEDKVWSTIISIQETLETKDEPVAWRTFDGEGGYDYQIYENNEDYANDWDKRNPKHKGWVEPLYTTPQRTWIGLTDEDMGFLFPHGKSVWVQEIVKIIEAKLKEKNT